MSYPIAWSPHWAEGKIRGSHTKWEPGEDQRIEATCQVCGATMQRTCPSGNARHWISLFASTHAALHA